MDGVHATEHAMMQESCGRIVVRGGEPERCGRVLNVDGTCCNKGKHVRVRANEILPSKA